MNLAELLASVGVHIPVDCVVPVGPGARVRKTHSEPGDAHEDGAPGTLHGHVVSRDGALAICLVEWDDAPGQYVFVAAHRVVRLT